MAICSTIGTRICDPLLWSCNDPLGHTTDPTLRSISRQFTTPSLYATYSILNWKKKKTVQIDQPDVRLSLTSFKVNFTFVIYHQFLTCLPLFVSVECLFKRQLLQKEGPSLFKVGTQFMTINASAAWSLHFPWDKHTNCIIMLEKNHPDLEKKTVNDNSREAFFSLSTSNFHKKYLFFIP